MVDADTPENGVALLYEITTGALPDAATFTPDCKKILTADEGEAGLDVDGNFLNPEGAVTIVDLEALANGQEGIQTVDFQFVNEDVETFLGQSVRYSWRGQTLEPELRAAQTLSRDIEPEQVIITRVSPVHYLRIIIVHNEQRINSLINIRHLKTRNNRSAHLDP